MKSFLTPVSISISILISFCFAVLLSGSLYAHGTGESLEKIVGEYNVDIGYDPVMLEAASPSFFDFDLVTEETGERAEFTDIWVRIVESKQTIFATGVHKPSLDNTTMVYTFPEGGEYEFKVRFQNDGEALAEASFPLTIEKATTGAGLPGFIWLAAGVFVGAIAGFFAGFVRTRK
jgi:hypothetical protein